MIFFKATRKKKKSYGLILCLLFIWISFFVCFFFFSDILCMQEQYLYHMATNHCPFKQLNTCVSCHSVIHNVYSSKHVSGLLKSQYQKTKQTASEEYILSGHLGHKCQHEAAKANYNPCSGHVLMNAAILYLKRGKSITIYVCCSHLLSNEYIYLRSVDLV